MAKAQRAAGLDDPLERRTAGKRRPQDAAYAAAGEVRDGYVVFLKDF
jgi:hypothetical protein